MIITISNNKGGVLKTTLATNIACELSKNYKVCLIDFDGQSNIANTFKTDGDIDKDIKFTLIDYLLGKASERDIIDQDINQYFKDNDINTLNIIYSNYQLNQYDLYLSKNKIQNSKLKELINKLEKIFDYIVIDTPPNLSTITSIAIQLSDTLLIPFEPDRYAVKGLSMMINILKDNFKNKDRRVILVPTKVNLRTNLHSEYIRIVYAFLASAININISISNIYISNSTKSALAVATEYVPIIFSKNKTKQAKNIKEQIQNLTKEIIN